jgi:hypothetical protein
MAPPVPAFLLDFSRFFFNARRFSVAVTGNGFRGAPSASFSAWLKRVLASCSLYFVGGILVMEWTTSRHAATDVLKYYARPFAKNLINKDLLSIH